MARKVTAQQTPKVVTCMTCEHSDLHRYGNNPILSACKSKPQPGNSLFPFVVEVASVARHCEFYKGTCMEKTVEQRQKNYRA